MGLWVRVPLLVPKKIYKGDIMKDNDIISKKMIKERMIKIVRGEIKPSPNDPKVWYESKEVKERLLNK